MNELTDDRGYIFVQYYEDVHPVDESKLPKDCVFVRAGRSPMLFMNTRQEFGFDHGNEYNTIVECVGCIDLVNYDVTYYEHIQEVHTTSNNLLFT